VRSTEVGRYRVLKLRQQPQIRWCWRRWACSSPRAIRRYPLAETASRFGQPESAAVRFGWPEGRPFLLQWSHVDTTIRCAFSMLPKEHSVGSLRRPCLISVRERMAHLATLPGSSPVSRSFEKERLPPKRLGLCPCRRSDKPAVGRVARKRARCVRAGLDEAGRSCPPEWAAER
jgi:hypothetical protein